MRRWPVAAVLVVLAWLALPPAAMACNGWTEPDMETQLMCTVCHERLDQSNSAFAGRVRVNLHRWCGDAWTADRVRSTLVAQFGEEILAAPPKRGFDLLAWVVPAAVLAVGAAVAMGLTLAWSRSRRGPPGRSLPPDPALDARIDADLRGLD